MARRWPRSVDPLILACAAVLVAFPFAATLAASQQPASARSGAPTWVAAGSSGPELRDVPAFTPGGSAAAAVARGDVLADRRAMREALGATTDEFFGGRARASIEALLADSGAVTSGAEPPYPFRFPRLDAALDAALSQPLDARRVAAANDLGALLVLAAALHGEDPGLTAAAPLAYALLDRARAGGACLPQLNLAFLVSTHARPRDEATAAELRAAERRCAGDPTPLWLLGQFQSQRVVLELPQGASGSSELRRALSTFQRLQRRFPGSAAGWAGEADAQLRAGYQLREAQPFAARSRFRRALALYRRARALDDDPSLAAGEARALAALGLFAAAAREQREAIAAAGGPAPLEARLVEDLERGRRFGEAAGVAARLAAEPRFPNGPALLMHVEPPLELRDEEDAQGPLSLGSGRVLAVRLDVAPLGGVETGGAAGLLDLSFVPAYRHVDAVTGHDRWCPGWAHRRDLVLAGRPGEALAGLPERFADLRPAAGATDCPATTADVPGVPLLAALAALEAGDERAAVERVTQAGLASGRRRALAVLLDAQQNLWRFAGDLDRARAAAERWTAEDPASAVAFDRAGEVAFLQEDYAGAARLFAVSARIARSDAGTWSHREAMALLKRGTALELAGRYQQALVELRQSDEVASRAHGLADNASDAADRAAYVSYNARLQAGDTYLRTRRYAEALEQYAAAQERSRDLPRVAPGGPLRRPEVLDNNEAVVQLQLGNPAAAAEAARRALRSDPLNPVFLQNMGSALHRQELREQAAAAYRAAVESDPTVFPAWNDLGVALAEQGRLPEAAEAFRRAIAVSSGYALGWFNLGVALERLGPRNLLASEGAFGRAFRADPELRGRSRTFVSDDEPYFTTLDLSKPLPPQWEFARAQERTPVAVAGLAVALLFGLQFGRVALAPGLGGDARRWLDPVREALARLPRPLLSTTAGIAVAATIAVFLLPLLRSGAATLATALVLAGGVLALMAIVIRSRILVARRAGVTLRHRGWPPGIAVGLGAAAAGLGWAPLPVAETDRPAPAVHWVGPIAMGLAALVLLSLGAGLEVPATKALGTAALVMTASLLTPVEPVDGGFVARGPAGLAAALAVLAAALFFLLRLA